MSRTIGTGDLGSLNTSDELRFVLGFWEKRPAGPRVADATAAVDNAESLPGLRDIATDNNHCARIFSTYQAAGAAGA